MHTLRIRIIAYGFFALGVFALLPMIPTESFWPDVPSTGTAPAAVSSTFVYSFNSTGILREAGSMSESTSPYWWVNSGARLVIRDGLGMTAQGELPVSDPFRVLYAVMNPIDTELGRYPQNTFRLVSKNMWDDVRLQAYFRIVKDNLTASPNRNASNGLLFMSRYEDSRTLYYAGIRVDGAAVIKKKYQGTYYTMAYKKIFDGSYSPQNPNLLPHGEWMGLRSETRTHADGTVTVRLYLQREGGTWQLILEAHDDGKKYGNTPIIPGPGYAGIRTDFMDVQFKSYRADDLTP